MQYKQPKTKFSRKIIQKCKSEELTNAIHSINNENQQTTMV